MSVKLYHGYKLTKKMSLDELQNFSMELRRKMNQAAVTILEKRIAEIATDLIDTLFARGEKAVQEKYKNEPSFSMEFPLLSQSYWIIYDRQQEIRKTQNRNPKYDFDCSVIFIPIPRKILALFYAEQKEYIDAWRECKEVKEYAYYDNTDKPKGITKKQWDTRKKDWKQALSDWGIPSLNGMQIECVNDVPDIQEISRERILSYIPSLETRAYKQASDIVFSRKWLEFKEQEKYNYINYVVNAQVVRWLRSEEGRLEIEKEKENVLKKLKSSITISDLNQRLMNFNASK